MKSNIKKILIIGLILIFSIGLGGCVNKNVEGLVAEVNGQEITQEEFDSEYAIYKNQFESQLGEGTLEQPHPDGGTYGEVLRVNILEKLIIEKLVAKESSNLNISVSDEEIKAKIDEYLKEMDGQEKFDEFLASLQLSQEYFESNLRKELLFDKYRAEILKDVSISEESIKEYFEENKEDLVVVRASHILVDSEEKAKSALDRLNNGEVFEKVAMDVSMDGSALNGGDLGYFPKGQMIQEFEDAAFALKEGETSRLVKTEVGYHIIKIVDRKDSYDDLKDDIILVLKEGKYKNKMQELRDKAKVEKYLEPKEAK